MRRRLPDWFVAGSTAAVVSGIPSTAIALARGDDPLAASRAAGSILLPRENRTVPLLLAATAAHGTLSLGWAAALAAVVPRGHEITGGLAGGLAIAALDLELIARARFPRVRELAQAPQWLDHAAYGLVVGVVLRARRRMG